MERRFAKQAHRWSKGAGWLFCDWQTNKGSRLGEACYSHRLGGGGSRVQTGDMGYMCSGTWVTHFLFVILVLEEPILWVGKNVIQCQNVWNL